MVDQLTIPIESISLDLNNYRILPQANEEDALRAIVAINPNRFWALVESLLEDGYHPTDNLLLLKTGKGGKTLMVKEGNRRVAAIKLILGILPGDGVNIPGNIQTAMDALQDDIKPMLRTVPCLVYTPEEAGTLDKAITRIHGKGDNASRTEWTAVAKARHNRIANPDGEPGLDLLEKYLKAGKNLQTNQREQWAGDYYITILNEALQKLAPKLGLKSVREVVDPYPKGSLRTCLEAMMLAIGEGTFTFKRLRDEADVFFVKFGFPITNGNAGASPQGGAGAGQLGPSGNGGQKKPGAPAAGGTGTGSAPAPGNPSPQPAGPKKPRSKATNDPASVIPKLKKLQPKGANRAKVVTLQKEAIGLSLDSDGQPHAFCFLLRSMIELAAKAYCDDHAADGLTYVDKKDGRDLELSKVLRSVTDHLTNQHQDKAAERRIKGAMAELSNPHGFLSVNSMNQLIHHPSFSVDGPHIAIVFHNVFPLLEALCE